MFVLGWGVQRHLEEVMLSLCDWLPTEEELIGGKAKRQP
jgi:hypothetical protein